MPGPRSVQDASFDEEGEGAWTSLEGEVASQHRRRLVGGEGPRTDDVENPRPEVFAMSGSDTKSNGFGRRGSRRCGTNRSSQSFEHGVEGESTVESMRCASRTLLKTCPSDAVCPVRDERRLLRIALQEIIDGTEAPCEVRTVRGLEIAFVVAQDAPLPWPPRRAQPNEAVGDTIETIPKWRLAHSSH